MCIRDSYYSLEALEQKVGGNIGRLPFSIRILLEQALRNYDDFQVLEEHVHTLANWDGSVSDKEIPHKPTRVILQDFTGVPAVVDLASLRSAMAEMGGDPEVINPRVPVDLVIDHSVQVTSAVRILLIGICRLNSSAIKNAMSSSSGDRTPSGSSVHFHQGSALSTRLTWNM